MSAAEPLPTEDLLAGLNPVQREAVTHGTGPLLIVAGAGSGKTRVLTHRIAWLIGEQHVSPFQILAITFTNKAADEMKQRVAALVGPVAEKMWVSTFHSACVRILRRDAPRLGYKSSFTIYDQADSVRLVGYVLRDLNIDTKRFPARQVHATISAAKNDLVDFETYAGRARTIHERRIADVYREYQKRLLAASAMDFDDLLTVAVNLLQSQPDVLEYYQQRFIHLLVDEYQDTNRAQNELVMLIGKHHRNVCVVGDSDQCLPPGTMIDTPDGRRPIETLAEGDEVLGTVGTTGPAPGIVTAVRERYYRGRLYTVCAGGFELRATSHHIVPVTVGFAPTIWHVSLLYRADRGYRIGVTNGRTDADAAWILRTYPSHRTARHWQGVVAAPYGLPTKKFDTVDDIYERVDTRTLAKQVFDDFDLHPSYPHIAGGEVWPVTVRMFSGPGVRVTTPDGDKRYADYPSARRSAHAAADRFGVPIQELAVIGGRTFGFQPVSHVRPGMGVLIEDGGQLRPVPVERVTAEDGYDGPVYDVEVTPTHTYIANGVLVHNSVYRFRGADIRNILEFEEAFPDATVIVLEQNYRSTQTILDAANAVIANNMMRKPKALWTEQVGGELISRYHADDEHDEAQFVVRELARLHDHGDRRWSEFAIFYRTNAQSRVLEEHLMRANVPYKVFGGTRFYDRREIKDALAYVRAAINPQDEVSIKRVVNTPKRGVGDTSIAKVDAYATLHGLPYLE